MSLRIFILLLFTFIFISCSKDKPLYEPIARIDPYKSYGEAFEAFQKNDFFYANKKFSEAEINFKDPELAAKSAIMSAYSLYGVSLYDEAEENLIRYLRTYPADKYVVYAHYLSAIIYFEQIGEEKHDLKPLLEAREKIDFFFGKIPEQRIRYRLKFQEGFSSKSICCQRIICC